MPDRKISPTSFSLKLSDFSLRIEDRVGVDLDFFREHFSTAERGDDETADGVFQILPWRPGLEPAEGAVRTRALKLSPETEYRLGKTLFDFKGNDFFAVRDFEAYRTQIYLGAASRDNLKNLRAALKWLFIKVAEKKGHLFLHASAARLQGKTLAFSGHSGAGKSSCLVRLLRAGAEIISDDTLLYDGQCVVPFDLIPSQKGDFAERFSDMKKALTQLSPARAPTGVDVLVFPEIWHSRHSRFVPLSSEEALARLLQIYRKEQEWNAVPEPDASVRDHYAKLLGGVALYRFSAGMDEAEAQRVLVDGALAAKSKT